MTSVLMFPGQGSQEPGMRELVESTCPGLLEAASRAVGDDPFERIEDGTAYLQPAIYCASMAALERAAEPEPDFYAGHSLGELSALVAAGALSVADGLELVTVRGRLMQRAAELGPVGGMLAVGAGREVAAEIAGPLGLTIANDNSPGQVVLSGPADAIAAGRVEARGRGLRAFRLPIRGAFHSAAMEPVVAEFRSALDAIDLHAPQRPVLSCVTAREFDDIRLRLCESLTHGVRWREVLQALHGRGARRFVEVGPGRVLTGLVRKTLPGVEALAPAALQATHA
jgi:[acyl-carrier-protein] S-malonyltransferase